MHGAPFACGPAHRNCGDAVTVHFPFAHRTNQRIFTLASAEARHGGLAQLARALAWHARGHRFDSDILHPRLNDGVPKGAPFFVVWQGLQKVLLSLMSPCKIPDGIKQLCQT